MRPLQPNKTKNSFQNNPNKANNRRGLFKNCACGENDMESIYFIFDTF